MYVLVVDRIESGAAASLRALAEALGKAAYECRPIINAPGHGPIVVACHARADDAEAMAARIGNAGFEVAMVPDTVASMARAFMTRSFVLGDAALTVETRDGRRLEIHYGEVEVLVRGNEVQQHSETKTTTTRKLDLGRAVLSSGLMMTRKEKTKTTTTSTDSQGFVVVYGRATPAVALWEKAVLYQSLGAAMQPSRMANFLYLAGELRRRCVNATWDERLIRRTVQQQTLGPTLSTDDHLDLAITLVAASARRGQA